MDRDRVLPDDAGARVRLHDGQAYWMIEHRSVTGAAVEVAPACSVREWSASSLIR